MFTVPMETPIGVLWTRPDPAVSACVFPLQENVALQERAFALKERQQTLDGKIKELTEKEELLNYFVRQNDISLAVLRAAKPDEEIGEVDLEEYVAEPGTV